MISRPWIGRAIVHNSTDHWTLFSISETGSPWMADFRIVSGRRKETRGIVLNRDERTMRVLLALEVNVSYSTSYLNTFHPTIKGSRLYHSNC